MVYKPRSGKINANLQFYSQSQLAYIYQHCNTSMRLIDKFGYVKYFEQGLSGTIDDAPLLAIINKSKEKVRQTIDEINAEMLEAAK